MINFSMMPLVFILDSLHVLNNSFLFENGDFFINIYRLFPYYFLKFRLFFNFFHAIKNTLCLMTEGVLDLKAGDDLLSHG